jgi:hypothetical protein
VQSDVVVTNMRGSYNEYLSAHAVAFLLAFARHRLGMRVLGTDPRVTEPPTGMADLFTPDRLEERLGEAERKNSALALQEGQGNKTPCEEMRLCI